MPCAAFVRRPSVRTAAYDRCACATRQYVRRFPPDCPQNRTCTPCLTVVMRAGRWSEAPDFADLFHDCMPVSPEEFFCFRGILTDEARCCDRDLHSFRCDFRLGGRAPVKISQRCKTRCLPTDDCVGNWQTEQASTNRRMRISPVASQTGSEPLSGRGTTSASFNAGRNLPCQVTFSLSLIFKSRSSFSA